MSPKNKSKRSSKHIKSELSSSTPSSGVSGENSLQSLLDPTPQVKEELTELNKRLEIVIDNVHKLETEKVRIFKQIEDIENGEKVEHIADRSEAELVSAS
nr:unnamed protein product [Haemonchus contortus]